MKKIMILKLKWHERVYHCKDPIYYVVKMPNINVNVYLFMARDVYMTRESHHLSYFAKITYQEKGRSPVCLLMCSRSVFMQEKLCPQPSALHKNFIILNKVISN